MKLRFTCQDTAAFLAGAGEPPAPPLQSLRVKLHLFRCPQCRALEATLRALPQLAGRALEPEEGFQAASQAALQGALERLGRLGEDRVPRAWPRTPVPQAAQILLDAGADLPLRILASTHSTLALERRRPTTPHHLPPATLLQLPPEAQWAWESDPDGLRRAELLADPVGGQRLFLVHAPPGARLAPHRHLGSESILVLDGAMEDRGLAWEAGTWIHHSRGSSHGPRIPACGCWFLVREEGSVRFQGPTGWLRKVRPAS